MTESTDDIVKEAERKKQIKEDINNLTVDESLKAILRKKYNITSNVKRTKLFELVASKPKFILEEILPLPQDAITIISARGDTGKSILALYLALEASVRGIKTALWSSEDPEYLTKYRAEMLIKLKGLKIDENADLIVTGHIPFKTFSKERFETIINPVFEEFKETYADRQLIILDPLIAFYGGDENSNREARNFMDLYSEYAYKQGKTIVFMHHQGKSNSGEMRGASAFVDAVRAHYTVTKDEQDNRYVNVKIAKDNFGITNFFSGARIQVFEKKIKKDTGVNNDTKKFTNTKKIISNTSNKPTREELIVQIVKIKPDVDVKRLEQLTINQLISTLVRLNRGVM